MIARDDVDAVGIYTSSGTHCDYAIEAIAAGKHAFVTKPMDILVEKCDAAIRAAKDASKVLAVDFGNRYSKANQQLKAALDQGIIGQIFLGDVKMKWWREQSYYNGGFPGRMAQPQRNRGRVNPRRAFCRSDLLATRPGQRGLWTQCDHDPRH